MTTLGSAQAPKRRRLTCVLSAALVASLATLGLGGCSSGSSLLGGAGSTAPEAALAQPTSTASVQTAKVQIAPVIGSPENVAKDLQAQLASAVGRNGVSVTTASNATGQYVVRGYVVAAREKTKAKISYIWDVTDQGGKRVHRITGEEVATGAGKDPWGAVTPDVIQRIAGKTASQIASWLPGAGGVPMASNTGATQTAPASNAAAAATTATASTEPDPLPTPTNASYTTASNAAPSAASASSTTGSIATSGPITAVVPMVTGAPGDGSSSLTSAIQRELTKGGLALATQPDSRSYKVEGKVAMSDGKDGKQAIQIDWNVIDPAGKKLGTVSQKNEIPQGSLDGTWGKTADAAAAAAAQGIIKLLPPKSAN